MGVMRLARRVSYLGRQPLMLVHYSNVSYSTLVGVQAGPKRKLTPKETDS